ncbi:Glycopeptide antibiotics resistance protein [Cohnella sp. OV330]|uniref:VanZ family protein n=1 Tax=Cohnella sp. OV330 TaxID=1855288 RepID=UPI0008EBCC17|nr:VanZ family protein [Cohnella sp. OV330]SFA92349.1 Glycopeptide antibiotics resistance protein [Cohnella sp. OV330]
MLGSYLFPISYAFLSFPIAAAIFTVPFLVVQYRRHGYVHKIRALILYLLLLYLLNAVFIILLPLPPSIHNAPPDAGSYFQWIPFHFLTDIVRETGVKPGRPSTYPHLLGERAVLQVAFNVLLTIPFGLFLRYYFSAHWIRCLLLSLGLSLLFETTQVTGIFGIFDYPYRLFDVDDLITNTAGGMLGYVLAEWFASRLPRIDRLDAEVDLSLKRVSYTRRALAAGIDWCLLLPVCAVLGMLRLPILYVFGFVVIVYFIVIPYATNGRTAGKWVVRIRVRGKGERVALQELIVRYGLLYLLAGGINLTYPIVAVRDFPPLVLIPYAVGLFAMNVWLGIHLIRCVLGRRRVPFHDRWSGTRQVVS